MAGAAKHASTSKRAAQDMRTWRRHWRPLLVVLLTCLGAVSVWAWNTISLRERGSALDLARAGKFQEAGPALRRLLERQPSDVDILKALIAGEVAGGNLVEAASYLRAWSAAKPTESEPLRQLLEVSLRNRQIADALDAGRRFLELEPHNQAVRAQVARLAVLTGSLDEAERACRKFLEMEPGNPDILLLLAEICRQRADAARTQVVLDRLLREFPNHPQALYLRAVLHAEADETDLAAAGFRKVMEIDERGAQHNAARYQLSLLLARSGKSAEAEQLLAEVNLQQAFDHVRMAYGAPSGQASGDDLLRQAMEKLNQSDQPNAWALVARVAEAKIGTGKYDEAAQLLGRIMEKDANWVEESVRLLKKIIEKEPKHAIAHELLASYYERAGKLEAAAEHRRLAKP